MISLQYPAIVLRFVALACLAGVVTASRLPAQVAFLELTGPSTETDGTAASGYGAGITLESQSATAGNYTAIENVNADGVANARLNFVNLAHGANASGAIDFLVGTGSGTTLSRIARFDVGALTINGKLGVGTTTPGSALTVKANSSATSAVLPTNAAAVFEMGSSNAVISLAGGAAYELAYVFSNASGAYDGALGYSNSNRALYFSTAGTEKMRITSAGKVGIGTSNPQQVLHVSNADQLAGVFESTVPGGSFFLTTPNQVASAGDFSNEILFTTSNNARSSASALVRLQSIETSNSPLMADFAIATNSGGSVTEKMRVTGSGNVGIGLANPGAKLSVGHSSGQSAHFEGYLGIGVTPTYNNATQLHVTNQVNQSLPTLLLLQNKSTGRSAVRLVSGANVGDQFATDWYMETNGGTSGDLHFREQQASGTPIRATIKAGGNVGIGTTSPTARTVIADNEYAGSSLFEIQADDQAPWQFSIFNKAYSTTNPFRLFLDNGGTARFYNAGSVAMSILPSGNVGVGTSTPAARLDVAGDGRFTGNLTLGGNLAVNGGGAGLPSGRFVVSSASSGGTSHTSADDLVVENSTDAGVSILSGAANQGIINFGDSGDNDIGSIRYDHASDALRFIANNGEGMRIASTGNVGIGTTAPSVKFEVSSPFSGSAVDGPAMRITNGAHGAPSGVGNLIGALDFYSGDQNTPGLKAQIRAIGDASSNWGPGGNSRTNLFLAGSDSGALASGLTINYAGNVGIGTIAPAKRLEVSQDAATNSVGAGEVLRLIGDDGNTLGRVTEVGFGVGPTGGTYAPALIGAVVTNASAFNTKDLYFATRSTPADSAPVERMRITAAGNVGIGTSNPVMPLHVLGLATIQFPHAAATLSPLNLYSGLGNPTLQVVTRPADGSTAGIHVYTGGTNGGTFLGPGAGGGDGMWSAGASYWGSGVYMPQFTSASVIHQDSGTIIFGSSSGLTVGTTAALTERMRLTTGGSLGIGTSAPQSTLHVVGATMPLRIERSGVDFIEFVNGASTWTLAPAAHVFKIGAASGIANNILFANTTSGSNGVSITANNAEVVRIAGTGNVGIGTTTPTARLDVGGDARITGNLTLGGNLAVTGTFNAPGLTSGGLTGAANGLVLNAGAADKSVSFETTGTGGVVMQRASGKAWQKLSSTTDQAFLELIGASTQTNGTAANGFGAGIYLKAQDSTVGNYASVENVNANGVANARLNFVNLSHAAANAAGAVDVLVGSSGGATLSRVVRFDATAFTVDTGSIVGGAAGLTLSAGGANQNIALTPNGTGDVIVNGKMLVGTTTDSNNGQLQLGGASGPTAGIGFGPNIPVYRRNYGGGIEALTVGHTMLLENSPNEGGGGSVLAMHWHIRPTDQYFTGLWNNVNSGWLSLRSGAGLSLRSIDNASYPIAFNVGNWNGTSFSEQTVMQVNGNNGTNPYVKIFPTTASTSTTTGALVVAGGAGVAGNLNTGGNLAVAGTATITGQTNVGTLVASGQVSAASASVTNNLTVGGSATVTGAVSAGGAVTGSTVTASSGAFNGGATGLTLNAGAANQSITLAPNGDGAVVVSNPAPAKVARLSFVNDQANPANFDYPGSGATYTLFGGALNAAGWMVLDQKQAGKGIALAAAGTGSIVFGTNAAERGRFDGAGNLLLGKTVAGTNGRLQLADHTAKEGGIGLGTDLAIYRSNAGELSFATSDVVRASITASGIRAAGDGTAAAAAYAFGGAAGTGMYRNGAALALASAGTTSAQFGASSVSIPLTGNSTSASTGALVVAGGVGIGGNQYIGGTQNVGGDQNVTGTLRVGPAQQTTISGGNISTSGTITAAGTMTAASYVSTTGSIASSSGTALTLAGASGQNVNLVATGGGKVSAQGNFESTGSITAQGTIVAAGQNNLLVGGKVGIGMTSGTPAQKLDIVGGSAIVDNNQGYLFRNASGTADGKLYEAANGSVRTYVNGADRVTVTSDGKVGIGTTTPSHTLAVNGTIRAREVIVENTNWPDYIFDENYRNAPLSEVEAHIKEHKHLPGVPSAREIGEKGVSVGEMQTVLLAKIEQLTLHLIEQEKRINRLEAENTALRQQR